MVKRIKISQYEQAVADVVRTAQAQMSAIADAEEETAVLSTRLSDNIARLAICTASEISLLAPAEMGGIARHHAQ